MNIIKRVELGDTELKNINFREIKELLMTEPGLFVNKRKLKYKLADIMLKKMLNPKQA